MEIGRLTQDVAVEEVGDGKKVMNNRVAIRVSKNTTTFLDVVAWGETAELIGKYFRKGYEIAFEGRLLNKRKFVAKDVEAETVVAVIEKVRFTHGNPVAGSESKEEEEKLFLD